MSSAPATLLGLWGALAVLVVVGAVFDGYARLSGPGRPQPLPFSHKSHVALGLECSACHAGIAAGRARAGLPAVEVCAACHGPEDDTPGAAAVREHVAAGRAIPWRRVYAAPPDVHFSHHRHAGLAKLDCALCHGDLSRAQAPVTEPAIKIGMARCMGCHSRMQASNDCLACHR